VAGSKIYTNADGSSNVRTFAEVRKWRKERRAKVKDMSFRVPRAEPDAAFLAANRTEATVTFIGHATFLIQLGGLNIVTDPVWASRMALTPRLSPPGLPVSALPPVDVVLISHSHYDHLHLGSLRRLPGDFLCLVPEGLGRWFRRRGFRRVREHGWWDEAAYGEVAFTFVPARHWTRRTPWDTNRSHWGGWVMRRGGDALYFAGDSG